MIPASPGFSLRPSKANHIRNSGFLIFNNGELWDRMQTDSLSPLFKHHSQDRDNLQLQFFHQEWSSLVTRNSKTGVPLLLSQRPLAVTQSLLEKTVGAMAEAHGFSFSETTVLIDPCDGRFSALSDTRVFHKVLINSSVHFISPPLGHSEVRYCSMKV